MASATDQQLFSVKIPGRPLRRAAPWVALALVAATVALFVATGEAFGWPVVGEYLFSPRILSGLLGTIELTVIAGLIALILGAALVGIARWGSVGRAIAGAYIWFFRAVPLMVQLIFWFNAALIVPSVFGASTNDLIDGFRAAILGLALHEAAYFAEILRGGLLAIPAGQYRAAAALGMTGSQAYRHVIGPEVIRVTTPALSNQVISLLKATATVVYIGGSDLLTAATHIYQQNFETIPLLIVATIWYLVLVALATAGQNLLERRLTGVPTSTSVKEPA